MGTENIKRDIISEQTFNKHVRPVSSAPERDSRGDSQADVNLEYQSGLNYMPDEKNEYGKQVEEDIPVFDLGLSGSSEEPSGEDVAMPRISENARVTHAGRPSPREDLDADSSTH